MATRHRGESPLGKDAKRARASVGALRWSRRLCFEPLEDRRLLAIIPVTTIADENNGTGLVSLREAIGTANVGDTITFSVNGTIQLLGTTGFGQILIGKSLTIQGPGANLLTIRAFDPDAGGTNDSDGRRVFLVDDNLSTLNVTISGLTLTNGDPTVIDEHDGGGAILSRENLTLNACVMTGNFAPNGGAILNTEGTLALNDCTISNNNGSDGGAVMITGGSLAVTRSKITNNQVTNAGGGIALLDRPVTIVDSTISGNFADESGGGLYQFGGSMSVTGSTISSNGADNNHDGIGGGGGISNTSGALAVLSSTISGNSAGENGAGIFSNTSQTISVKFSTITGNVVANSGLAFGGGIHSANTASVDHTIVAGNLRGASTRDDVAGMFDAFYSLIGDKRGEIVNDIGGSLIGQNGSVTNPPIDAKLGPLANNGGLTLTRALLSESPALEAGNLAAVADSGGVPPFDQRGTGFPRVAGTRIDIGAVEMTPAAPTLPGDYNLNHSVDAADYVLWRKTTGTGVAQPYSGADGDGNSAVNSSDYTVWRSHFGNTSPGPGSGAQEISDEPVRSESAAISSDRMDATSWAFASLASWPVTSTASGAMIRTGQSVSTDEATSSELLLVIGDAAGGVNQVVESSPGSSEIELVGEDAMWDGVCELVTGGLKAQLVVL